MMPSEKVVLDHSDVTGPVKAGWNAKKSVGKRFLFF
jgi:hypothetical protein